MEDNIKILHTKIQYYKAKYGVEPNLIHVSIDKYNELISADQIYNHERPKITCFGIEVSVDMYSADKIEVGFME